MAADRCRVAVFIDWQNAYRSARRAFDLEAMPNEWGNFSPFELTRVLARGNGRGAHGELCRVDIHRGLPTSAKDPKGHGACRRQAAAWTSESPLVRAHLRPLRYPREWPAEPPREKGIDVELAVGIIECVLTDGCDVAILWTNDTDLIPALEMVVRHKGASAVETAAWSSNRGTPRLRPRGVKPYHHHVTREVFNAVEARVNYAYEGPRT